MVSRMLQRVDGELAQFNYFDRMARNSRGYTQIPESAILYAGFYEKVPFLAETDSLYVSRQNYFLAPSLDNFRGQQCLKARHGFSAIMMSPKAGDFTQKFGSGSQGRPHAYFLETLTAWADERGIDAIQTADDQFIIFDPSAVLRLLEVQEFLPITLDQAV